ncbi:MAG TPA: sulfatase-like hydrolase/transferase [Kofleriaceae bacterium]|nr:sulfatase-like hydrolase/transferase [Kofleriaceae bacterium]
MTPAPRRHRGLPRALVDDLHVGARAAVGGLVAAALVEWVATIWVNPNGLGAVLDLRLLLLDVTLFAVLGIAIVPLCALAATVPRLRVALRDGGAAAAARPAPLVPPSRWAPSTTPAFLCGGLALIGYLVGVGAIGRRFEHTLKEETISALVLATVALAIGGLMLLAADVGAGLLERARRALARRWPRATAATPLGSPWAALALVVAAVLVTLRVDARIHPHLRGVWPRRYLLDALAFGAGAGLERELTLRWRPRLLAVHRFAIAALPLVFVPLVLVRCGGQPRVKAVASTWSPALARGIEVVRRSNDLDHDGFGSLLGENDCGPLDRHIHPGAVDKPDNGIDENCNGHDFSMRDLAVPSGPHRPVPPAFKKHWNVLFITIDTVRYDHTSFGGRNSGPNPRDTTPNLAKLVERSTSFTFCNAPTPGTMGSIPAILTSRFFHSGVALDETNIKPGMPPRLKPENTTLPEVMKRAGYTTGAILSHEYFNDWGMNQGVDDYDVSCCSTHDPDRVADNMVADRAISWIAAHPTGPWFLWTHFIDPHSTYVPHPGETSYGDSQEDLYDGEIHFTDKQIGRLLDQLIKLPGGDQTIVIVTSDHGDGFNEHGFTGHAIALARELLRVPMIIYVPDAPPRKVGGAVSNIDLFPTVAELCDIDISDLQIEGRSLVPQIFYGEEDPDRVVFGETNYPNPLRSATSPKWKLIFNLKGNFYELYDLVNDPMEKANVAGSRKDGMDLMKPILDNWLERVVFTRDPEHSQVAMRMEKVLLPGPPSPQHVVTGAGLDDGAIEILGYDVDGAVPGAKAKLGVYFHVVKPPTRRLRLGGVMMGLVNGAPGGADQVRAPARITLDGLFASDRWKVGDYLRDEWVLPIPNTWGSPEAAIGLTAVDAGGKPSGSIGNGFPGDPATLELGRITVPVTNLPSQRVPAPLPLPPPPPPALAPTTLAPVAPAPAISPSRRANHS